ncbi:hypothetical protein [Actinoplanes flavus]|uniref:WD40-like Beta Propeller Repeat n=1 Tax=Actinoplanes flavus TaxID=2820290 RepID=A0ABS3USK9_9ACTN|nr:hypothetical protein [Actinoplanes flavus]MBO3741572.1 hypothetical protein [Actinoplanes flavus]
MTARIAAVTTLVTMLVLCCGFAGLAGEWHPAGGTARALSPGDGSLPERIGAPPLWTPDGLAAPIGAASVLFTSNTWFGDESGHLTGLVGRDDDTYRVTELYGPAGLSSVISPDGTRLAVDDGVADLATGRITPFRPRDDTDDSHLEPQAWSPDGNTVAVLFGWWNDGGRADGVHLKLVDVRSGATREIAELSPMAALPGWTVAFSPDGTRLAVQVEDRIRVLTLADGTSVDLPLPAGARIAGKGAWTRDGRSLLVVSGEKCDCAGYPRRWTVQTISAADGTVGGPSWTRDGVYALRVLGWWRGRPATVEYTATRVAQPSVFADAVAREELTSQDGIERARLIELGGGRELLSGDGIPLNGDVESIDVPDRILAQGRARAGSPPLLDVEALTLLPLTVVLTGLLVLLFLGVWWLAVRLWPQPH